MECVQKWTPRAHAWAWFSGLAACHMALYMSLLVAPTSSGPTLMPVCEAPHHAHSPTTPPLSLGWVDGSWQQLVLSHALSWREYLPPLSLDVKMALLFVALLNGGFWLSNFVTTARSHLFKGLQGYRDAIVVNIGVPLIVLPAAAPYACNLFPQHTAHWPAALHVFLMLLFGFDVGMHIVYLVRTGFCDKSLSAVDVTREMSWADKGGFLFRVVLISYFSASHLWWALDAGTLPLRIASYIAGVSLLLYVSHALRERYYFHWHHWAAGLMLLPLSHNTQPGTSLMLQGVLLAQFAEGASRWSCAPLWHWHHFK
ncbi:hypothetical protein EON68_04600, partial [archaeon]